MYEQRCVAKNVAKERQLFCQQCEHVLHGINVMKVFVNVLGGLYVGLVLIWIRPITFLEVHFSASRMSTIYLKPSTILVHLASFLLSTVCCPSLTKLLQT